MSASPDHRRRMVRYEHTHNLRFLTFSTYHQLPLFSNDKIKDAFARQIAGAKERFRFRLYAWCVMPEHVHLLIWPKIPEWPVKASLRELKREFASTVIGRWRALRAPILSRVTTGDGRARFWQVGGGYDRNVFSDEETREKIRYIHNNPVMRGLVERPELWAWSSARWYAGDRSGVVVVDPLPARKPE